MPTSSRATRTSGRSGSTHRRRCRSRFGRDRNTQRYCRHGSRSGQDHSGGPDHAYGRSTCRPRRSTRPRRPYPWESRVDSHPSACSTHPRPGSRSRHCGMRFGHRYRCSRTRRERIVRRRDRTLSRGHTSTRTCRSGIRGTGRRRRACHRWRPSPHTGGSPGCRPWPHSRRCSSRQAPRHRFQRRCRCGGWCNRSRSPCLPAPVRTCRFPGRRLRTGRSQPAAAAIGTHPRHRSGRRRTLWCRRADPASAA